MFRLSFGFKLQFKIQFSPKDKIPTVFFKYALTSNKSDRLICIEPTFFQLFNRHIRTLQVHDDNDK